MNDDGLARARLATLIQAERSARSGASGLLVRCAHSDHVGLVAVVDGDVETHSAVLVEARPARAGHLLAEIPALPCEVDRKAAVAVRDVVVYPSGGCRVDGRAEFISRRPPLRGEGAGSGEWLPAVRKKLVDA